MISALVGIGGGLGIVLAGPITENLNYHWLFWLPLLAIVPATIVTMVMVPESPIRTPAGSTCPAACCWPGGWWRCWWPSARGRAGAGARPRRSACSRWRVVLAVAWVVVEQRMRRAAGRHADAAAAAVWTTNLSATLIGFGMFASFVLIPQFVRRRRRGYGFGASVTEAGLFLLPATVVMLWPGRWPARCR